ncbi:MAG TPA: hypothetical protein VGI89_07595, partial [Rhizomicrobium sp.]
QRAGTVKTIRGIVLRGERREHKRAADHDGHQAVKTMQCIVLSGEGRELRRAAAATRSPLD